MTEGLGTRKRGAFRSVCFWASAALTPIVPLVIGLGFRNSAMAWLALVSWGFITLVTRFDDLAELSLGPVKARMRQVIQEANATIAQLHSLALSTSQLTLTSLMAGNFMGGMTLMKRLDLHDHLVETLRKIGFSEPMITEAETHWKKGMGCLYFHAIAGALEGRTHASQINMEATPQQRDAKAAFDKLLNFDEWEVPAPHVMRAFIESRNLLNDAVRALIDDYEHFLRTNEVRRREALVLRD